MKFTIIGKARAKGRPRVMRNGFTFTPKTTVEYENLVRLSFFQQIGEVEPTDKPLKVDITFYFDIPKSYTKKKIQEIKENNMAYPKKPDIDNLIKSITDALNGIAYKDDNQIYKVHANKLYTTSGARTEVEIMEI